MTQRDETPALSVERVPASAWMLGGLATAASPDGPASQGLHILGALGYGHAPGAPDVADGVEVPMLSGTPSMLDIWRTEGAMTSGRCGSVRWRHNGHWLWGAAELDDDDAAQAQGYALSDPAHRVYTDIFETLRQTGCGHLQRLWNYLPRINADGGGLERYRQFNTGRQKAFLQAGSAVFEGAPAACAIGTRGGPLCVRFLAGRGQPIPVENPRQVSAYHYPTTYGPTSPTFSRGALVDAGARRVALLISGTASIVDHHTVHHGDVREQTRETLRNLQAVIDAAHARTSARFELSNLECAVYVRRSADAPLIADLLQSTLGPASPICRSALHLQADICRSDLLVEIEAHAFAHGALAR